TSENGRRVDLPAVAVDPGFPQSSECVGYAVSGANQKKPLALGFLFPFVETVRGNQSAAAPLRGAQRRVVEDAFEARIDQEREFLRVLHPGGNEAPAGEGEMPLALIETHQGDGLGGGDIVARREIRPFLVAKEPPQGLGRRGDYEASAHEC